MLPLRACTLARLHNSSCHNGFVLDCILSRISRSLSFAVHCWRGTSTTENLLPLHANANQLSCNTEKLASVRDRAGCLSSLNMQQHVALAFKSYWCHAQHREVAAVQPAIANVRQVHRGSCCKHSKPEHIHAQLQLMKGSYNRMQVCLWNILVSYQVIRFHRHLLRCPGQHSS